MVNGIKLISLALPLALLIGAALSPLAPGCCSSTGDAVLKVAIPSDVCSLNPFLARMWVNRLVLDMVYDTLVLTDPRTGELMPWLASSWSLGDGLTITLREGASWHDGRPLTAWDVRFTLELARCLGILDQLVEDIEVLGDRELRVRTPDACALLIQLAHLYIVPEHVWGPRFVKDYDLAEHDAPRNELGFWEVRPKVWSFAPDPEMIGSGPFRLVRRTPGQGIRLVANEHYFMGRPKVSEIELVIITGFEARVQALVHGDVDILASPLGGTEGLAIEDIRIYEGHQRLELVFNLGAFPWGPLMITGGVSYGPEAARAIRRALSALVDKEALIRASLLGRAEVGYGPLPRSASPWYEPGIEDLGTYPWMDPGHNLGLAERILAEAGFCDTDGDGKFDTWIDPATGMEVELPPSITIECYGPEVSRLCDQVCRCFEELLDVDFTPPMPGRWPESGASLVVRAVPVLPLLSLLDYHSTSPENIGGFSHARYDELAEAAICLGDVEAAHECQRIFVSEVPAIVICFTKIYYAYSARLEGVVEGAEGPMNKLTAIQVAIGPAGPSPKPWAGLAAGLEPALAIVWASAAASLAASVVLIRRMVG